MNDAGGENAPTSLDDLVTAVATALMGVDSRTLEVLTQSVLRTLVEYFEVDEAFLRFHDSARRTTNLVAEWPPRAHVPDPDPLGVICFATADPIFAATEHLADIWTVRPDADTAEYQERVQSGSGVAATSVAGVPLRAGDRTSGLLGFIKFGDRGWDDDELRALRTIALLFAQTQASLHAEAQLRRIAHHDELTGLPNRRALLLHLEDVLAARGATGPAVLFVDVDRLKAMNDFLGHDAGDRFIVAVAERLVEAAGEEHLVARLGGDEFVVVMAGAVGEERAVAAAEALQQAVTAPMRLGGQALGRTVSVGVAVATPTVASVAEWLRNADQAVLAAKERGGNAVAAFTTAMAARERVRLAVEMNLPSALRAGLLAVHFQPIVDLPSGAVIGAEALLRWNHPTLGSVPPDLFVGVAEATNMAGELGEWVLDTACRQLAEWRAVLPGSVTADFTLAVNVSPVQLIATDFTETVARALARHGLAGSDLVLEVTEHAVVSDVAAALTTLQALRRLGVAIAIDDFGTGYSTLAQVKALPVTILKIDRGFVRDLGSSDDDDAIVRSIIGLAESFGLDVVAEGVETGIAADILADLGVTMAQGHLYSHPVPADQLLDRLRAAAFPASTAS